jgi:hypothetical protein
MPHTIQFAKWDHYNPLFVNESGKNRLKYRFFRSNEHYLYIYRVHHRYSLPYEDKPIFKSLLSNLMYTIHDRNSNVKMLRLKTKLKNRGNKLGDVKRSIGMFFKEWADKVDLDEFLAKYATPFSDD